MTVRLDENVLDESFIASSGPGGQNVNKVATAVQLRVRVYELGLPPPVFRRLKTLAGQRMNQAGELVITARTHRTREANRDEARERAQALIDAAHERPKPRAKTRLNRVGKAKRLEGKKKRGAVKKNRGAVRFD